MYLEIEGDVGDKVHDNEAGCVHSQLVGHVPVVDIHPTPVLHLGGKTTRQCKSQNIRALKSTLMKSAHTEVSRRPAHDTLTEVMLNCGEMINNRRYFVSNLLHNWGACQLRIPT